MEDRNRGSVTNYKGGMGRKIRGWFGREGTCVYLWLILVDVWQKTAKFCKAIIFQLKKNKVKKKRKSIMKESDLVWKIRESFPEPTSVGRGWVKLVKETACSKLYHVRDCRKPATMARQESIKEMQDKGKRRVSRRCLAIWLSYMFNL